MEQLDGAAGKHSSQIRKPATVRQWAQDLSLPVAGVTGVAAMAASFLDGPIWTARPNAGMVGGAMGAIGGWWQTYKLLPKHMAITSGMRIGRGIATASARVGTGACRG